MGQPVAQGVGCLKNVDSEDCRLLAAGWGKALPVAAANHTQTAPFSIAVRYVSRG